MLRQGVLVHQPMTDYGVVINLAILLYECDCT